MNYWTLTYCNVVILLSVKDLDLLLQHKLFSFVMISCLLCIACWVEYLQYVLTFCFFRCYVIVRPHRSTAYVDVAYSYRPSSVVCRSVCHASEPCKNGCTDRAAFWVEDLGGPGEPCIRWGPDPSMGRGKFFGEYGRPIVKYRDTLRSSVRRRLNR